ESICTAWKQQKSQSSSTIRSIFSRCFWGSNWPSCHTTSTPSRSPHSSAVSLPSLHQVLCRPALEKAARSFLRPSGAVLPSEGRASPPGQPASTAPTPKPVPLASVSRNERREADDSLLKGFSSIEVPWRQFNAIRRAGTVVLQLLKRAGLK